jgi:hypothetical protein
MAEDLLTRIRGEIREGMERSRAAYEEAQRLEAALAALGSRETGDPPARVRRASQPRKRSKARSARAPRGENLRRIREEIEQRPGATAGEVAAVIGIGRPTVASTLGKLAREGSLSAPCFLAGASDFAQRVKRLRIRRRRRRRLTPRPKPVLNARKFEARSQSPLRGACEGCCGPGPLRSPAALASSWTVPTRGENRTSGEAARLALRRGVPQRRTSAQAIGGTLLEARIFKLERDADAREQRRGPTLQAYALDWLDRYAGSGHDSVREKHAARVSPPARQLRADVFRS